jgi:hypothetical protein
MLKLLALAAALAGPVQQPRPCLTQAEAEAVTLVALPEIIRQTGATCAAALPPTSLLRQTQSPMLQRYDAEAARAWPAARGAVVKLSPSAEALLGSELARPLLTSLIAPLIAGRVATQDCPTIGRLVTALEPLPPRNTASVIVTAIAHAQTRRAVGGARATELPLCPAAR